MAQRPNGIQTDDRLTFYRCLRKNAYPKRIAKKIAKRFRRRSGDDVQAYACPNCDGWHVGHVPGSRGGPTDG